MVGYTTQALANEHIKDLRSRAEKSRRVTEGRRRAPRRSVLGGVRRLRRAFA